MDNYCSITREKCPAIWDNEIGYAEPESCPIGKYENSNRHRIVGGKRIHVIDDACKNAMHMDIPIIPGPIEDNHNMAELCFHNGEEHFRGKVISKLMDMQTNARGVQYSQLVALVEIVRCL